MLKEIEYIEKPRNWEEKYKGRTYRFSEYLLVGKCICECGNDNFIVKDRIISSSKHSSAPSDFEAELICSKCKETATLDHRH